MAWDIDQLFGNCSVGQPLNRIEGEAKWAFPALDVIEKKSELVIQAELPGFKKEQISVTVENNVLTLQAGRKEEPQIREGEFLRQERFYGSFYRQFELPQTVNAEALKATYKDGVLELILAKREDVKPKQVAIEVN